MSKKKKVIIGSCIVMGIGAFLCIIGVALGGRVRGISVGSNGVSVSTLYGTTNGEAPTYQSGEEDLDKFDSIKLETYYADVNIETAKDYGISYNLDDRYEFSYKIENGVLEVIQKRPNNVVSNFTWFSIGDSSQHYSTEREFITIYVPEDSKFECVDFYDECGSVVCDKFYAEELQIRAEYGDVELNGVGSKNATLTLDSGKLNVTSFSDGDFTAKNEYGNTVLKDVTAGQLNITANSGNLEVDEVTADNIIVYNEYGNVLLQKAQADGMDLKANSGSISLEDVETNDVVVKAEYGDVKGYNIKMNSLSGILNSGNCKMKDLTVNKVDLKAEYGSVELDLMTKLADYSYDLETEYGEISLGKKQMGERYESLEEGEKKIVVFCESGNIEIGGVK